MSEINLANLIKYFDAIIENAKDNGMEIFFPEIVDTPCGTRQDSEINLFDHEYVDQKTGHSGDDFYGSIYYPIENKYLKIEFCM